VHGGVVLSAVLELFGTFSFKRKSTANFMTYFYFESFLNAGTNIVIGKTIG